MNNNYDTEKLSTAHLQSQVATVHICGCKNEQNEGDEDGNPPTNHWAASLQLVGGGSVRLDMISGYGSDGLRGKIDFASKNYTYTENAMKPLSFPAKVYATVQIITQLTDSNGRGKYTFTKE